MIMAALNKETGRILISWFKNTLVDVDIILHHFGIPKKKRNELREIAKQVRKEQYG